MNLKIFAAWIKSRWDANPRPHDLAVMGLGLCGEAGEVVEHIKKQLRGSGPAPIDKLTLELGDVLHYWCCICNHFGIDPEDVMRANIEKLNQRKPDWLPPAEALPPKGPDFVPYAEWSKDRYAK